MGRVRDVQLFTLFRNFLTIYLPVQRKVSENTVVDYRISLNQLIEFISKKQQVPYMSVTFEMITKDNVNSFLDYLTEEKKFAPATRNNRLAAIKSFLSYASSVHPEYISLMGEISTIKIQKDDPFSKVEYMSELAVETILKMPDTRTRIGLRDQFFMILLYDTGARIQEIIDAKICEVKISSTSSIQLHGKGNKIRIVPLMENTVKHFKNYMKEFHSGETWESQNYIFYANHHGVMEKICDDTIRVRMNIYAEMARQECSEVPERVHPHLWRHSRAMHLYQHGMDLTLISQWLGHKQFTTTLVYAHADTETKRKAIEKAIGGTSPIEQISQATYKVEDEETLKKLYGLK